MLTSRDAAVTFAAVAAEASVSESFLYKHEELVSRIRSSRRPRGRAKARSQQEAASAASLRVQLDVVTDRLEKANQKIDVLTEENTALRGEVSDLRARLRRKPDDSAS